MNRVKKVFTWIHVGLWVVFGLLILLQLSTDRHPYWITLSVAFLLLCLYSFYSHFYLLTRYANKRKNGLYFLLLGIILFTGPIILLLVYAPKLPTWDAIFESYRVHLLSTAIFIFLGWLARVTENLVLNTIRKEQLEKQAVEAELFYLKSQINPHFLFNTLNNIYTLVYKQAAAAPEAVLRLASLMRYMIYESNAHTVPLSRELTYLQDYIGLQQLRYKNSPIIDIEIAGGMNNCFIAPLLFIHFLENAYKHSPARLQAGDIRVKIEVKNNELIFRSQNPVRPRTESAIDEPGGIGLPNIKKRLALLYPAKHSLDIQQSDTVFQVVLTIRDIHLQTHEREVDLLHH
jgi:sensor histidine kinase YesM